uniref:Uncharacterized protein n=1 Tax=Juglanconis oblonga TaxID=1940568 RepID=A0A291LIS8_9PEZI|nr:hypothetical protein [Juglanconis oblonga]ATI20413.1 hypothetical protein [Juglanconis oblonga]
MNASCSLCSGRKTLHSWSFTQSSISSTPGVDQRVRSLAYFMCIPPKALPLDFFLNQIILIILKKSIGLWDRRLLLLGIFACCLVILPYIDVGFSFLTRVLLTNTKEFA